MIAKRSLLFFVFPPVIIGAIVNYQVAPFTYTFMTFGPDDRTGEYWIDDLFSNGVRVSDEKISMAWEAQTMPCFLIDSKGKG